MRPAISAPHYRLSSQDLSTSVGPKDGSTMRPPSIPLPSPCSSYTANSAVIMSGAYCHAKDAANVLFGDSEFYEVQGCGSLTRLSRPSHNSENQRGHTASDCVDGSSPTSTHQHVYTRQYSPQYLIKCFRKFKAERIIGPHVSAPILTLAASNSEHRSHDMHPGPSDSTTKSFNPRVGCFPNRWDGSGMKEDTAAGVAARFGDSGGGRARGRGIVLDSLGSSATVASQPLPSRLGRGRGGRPPGMQLILPERRPEEAVRSPCEEIRPTADSDRLDEARSRGVAPRPDNANVPLWRRKQRSGSDVSTDPTSGNAASHPGSTSLTDSGAKTSEKSEPGQAGFLLSRVDGSRLLSSVPGLSSAVTGISTPPPSSFGKLAPIPDRRQRLKVEEDKSTTKVSTVPPPAPVVGKFGVRDANWVEDDWSSIRGTALSPQNSTARVQSESRQSAPQAGLVADSLLTQKAQNRLREAMKDEVQNKEFVKVAGETDPSKIINQQEAERTLAAEKVVATDRSSFWESPSVIQQIRASTPAESLPSSHRPLNVVSSNISSPVYSSSDTKLDTGLPCSDSLSSVLHQSLGSDFSQDSLHSTRLLLQLQKSLRSDRVEATLPPAPSMMIDNQPSLVDPLIDSLIERTLASQAGWNERKLESSSRSIIDQIVGRVMGTMPRTSDLNQYDVVSSPEAGAYLGQESRGQSQITAQSRLDSILQSLVAKKAVSSNAAAMQRVAAMQNSLAKAYEVSPYTTPVDPRANLSSFSHDQLLKSQTLHHGMVPPAVSPTNAPTSLSVIDRLPDIFNRARNAPTLFDKEVRGDFAAAELPYKRVAFNPAAKSSEVDNTLDVHAFGGRREEQTAWRQQPLLESETPTQPPRHPASLVEPSHQSFDQEAADQENRQLGLDDPVWEYCDPKGQIQGPFSSVQMKGWWEGNFFPGDLLMRFRPNSPWVPFRKLFPLELFDTFPPFCAFPIVKLTGHVVHPVSHVKLNAEASPPSQPYLDFPDVVHEETSGSRGSKRLQQTISEASDAKNSWPSHNRGSSGIETRSESPPLSDTGGLPISRAEQMTDSIKTMLGLSTSANAVSSRESSVEKVKSKVSPSTAQVKVLAPHSIINQSHFGSQQKTQLITPNPMMGIAVPPVRRIDSVIPEEPIVEKRPMLPVVPREPVPDLLDVMKEEEAEMEARLSASRQDSDLKRQREIASQGKAAWRLTSSQKAFENTEFDSEFPDPSALFQCVQSGNKSKVPKAELATPPLKGSRRTLQEFIKMEVKAPSQVKSVWGGRLSKSHNHHLDSEIEAMTRQMHAPVVEKTIKPKAAENGQSEKGESPSVQVNGKQKDSDWFTVCKKKPESAPVKKSASMPTTKKIPATPKSTRPTEAPVLKNTKVSQAEDMSPPNVTGEEIAEIRKLMKACKINLDETMIEFLKGFKTSDEIVDLLKDSIEDCDYLQTFATEFVGLTQNPFRTVSYGKNGPNTTSAGNATTGWKSAASHRPTTKASTNIAATGSLGANAPMSGSEPAAVPATTSKSALDTAIMLETSSKGKAGGKRAKKGGKGKAIDPSLLGFSVRSNRIMQGAIDYGD